MKKAQHTSRDCAPMTINHMRRGATYRATTRIGSAAGQFLGLETPHGDRSILLRGRTGTASISLADITSICPTAA
jgi:hypothetical protein